MASEVELERELTAISRAFGELRARLVLSLDQAAELSAANGFQISRNTIQKSEARRSSPKIDTIWRYARSLGYSRHQIIEEIIRQLDAADEAAKRMPSTLDELMEDLRVKAQADAVIRQRLEDISVELPADDAEKLKRFLDDDGGGAT